MPAGSRPFTPEFAFVVSGCRAAFDPLAPDPEWFEELDCGLVLRLARFHRVEGLLWTGVSRSADNFPSELTAPLAAKAPDIAAANLRALARCRELIGSFTGRGMTPPLFVKGLTTAAQAYANPFAKVAWDIDILIAPEDLAKAAELLQEHGYSPQIPSSTAALSAWHAREKESVWTKQQPDSPIELHTRLADHHRLIPSLSVNSPRQEVAIAPDVLLPTLRDEELFAYLSVHGASSAWFRLKWISDLAGFLHRKTGAELEALYDAAERLGAGRAPGQALLLADALFSSLDSAPDLRRRLTRDGALRTLSDAALAQVSGEPVEPTRRLLGTWTIHWTQLLLMPRLGFAATELWRQIRKAMLKP